MKDERHNAAGSREAPPAALHARVTGRVQGVGFRYTACREAARLGLAGWVQNGDAGEVEVWAEGPPEALEAFRGWLRRGPPYARVTAVDCTPMTPTGHYREFTVAY